MIASTLVSAASGLAGAPNALVVLVQFWTYSCINWMRTLSYVRAWADRSIEFLQPRVEAFAFTFG
jgi:hypothetical protein